MLLTSTPWSLVAVLCCMVSCIMMTWIVAAYTVQELLGTALSCASKKGHVECVRLLLDRGAGVNVVIVSCWLAVRTHRHGVAAACLYARCAASSCASGSLYVSWGVCEGNWLCV